MRRSDRSAETAPLAWFFPVVGLVLALALAWGFGFLQARESERRQQIPASYRHAAEADARQACIGTKTSRIFDCVYEKVEASKEQAQTEQDLSAQQRAASAGLASAIVITITLVVTTLGVWYIRRTLEATLEAVEDTARATREIQRSNDIAERHARMQSRPYFSPIGINWNIRTSGEVQYCEIRIVWKNHGATPTRNLLFNALGLWNDNTLQLEEIDVIFSPDSAKAIVGPNQEIWGQPIHISLEQISSIFKHETTFFIYGHAKYQDIFGDEEHVTSHLWQIGIIRFNDQPLEGDNVAEITWTIVGKVNNAT